MHHLNLISGINFLSRFVSLAYSTLLMLSHSLIHLPPAHHSHPSCISETADHLFHVSRDLTTQTVGSCVCKFYVN